MYSVLFRDLTNYAGFVGGSGNLSGLQPCVDDVRCLRFAMSGLTDVHVIDTLDRYGFTRISPAPWRGGNPDEWDAYPVDIGKLPDFRHDRAEHSNVDDRGGGGVPFRNASKRYFEVLLISHRLATSMRLPGTSRFTTTVRTGGSM